MRVCAALCGPATQCFVALEQRSSIVMEAFFTEVRRFGFEVVSEHLPHHQMVM